MKSPMIQNRQKSLHILHEGPVYPESCEETWGMYEYQFHEVPIDPKSAKEPWCVSWRPHACMNYSFMKSPVIQDQKKTSGIYIPPTSRSPHWSKISRRAFIFFNNEGPIHPKSWEENFWACMNFTSMKHPLTQNQQKNIHVFHEGPIHAKSWEEASCMYQMSLQAFYTKPLPTQNLKSAEEQSIQVFNGSPFQSKVMRRDFRHVFIATS